MSQFFRVLIFRVDRYSISCFIVERGVYPLSAFYIFGILVLTSPMLLPQETNLGLAGLEIPLILDLVPRTLLLPH